MFHRYLQAVSLTEGLQPKKLPTNDVLICNLYGINEVYANVVVYTVHMISQSIDGGATEADGGASAPV